MRRAVQQKLQTPRGMALALALPEMTSTHQGRIVPYSESASRRAQSCGHSFDGSSNVNAVAVRGVRHQGDKSSMRREHAQAGRLWAPGTNHRVSSGPRR